MPSTLSGVVARSAPGRCRWPRPGRSSPSSRPAPGRTSAPSQCSTTGSVGWREQLAVDSQVVVGAAGGRGQVPAAHQDRLRRRLPATSASCSSYAARDLVQACAGPGGSWSVPTPADDRGRRPPGPRRRCAGSARGWPPSPGPCRAARCPSPRRRRSRATTGGAGRRRVASQSTTAGAPGDVVARAGRRRRARRRTRSGWWRRGWSARCRLARGQPVGAAVRAGRTAALIGPAPGPRARRPSRGGLQAELGQLHPAGAGAEVPGERRVRRRRAAGTPPTAP